MRIVNRKGVFIGYLIGFIIGIFVLAIIWFFLFGDGKELIARVGIIIPGFEKENVSIERLELVRYDIVENNVGYFDGANWVVLERGEEKKLGDKRIREDFVRIDLGEDFIANNVLRSGIENELNLFRKAGGEEPLESLYDLSGVGRPEGYKLNLIPLLRAQVRNVLVTEEGDVNVMVFAKNDNRLYGVFKITTSGVLRFSRVDKVVEEGESSGVSIDEFVDVPRDWTLYEEVVGFVSGWRDSVLSRSTEIRLVDGEVYVCVEKRAERYLVVDLSEEVGENASCR